MVKNILLRFLVVLAFQWAGFARASTGYGPLMRAQIENTFFDDGRVSPRKVELFKANTELAHREVIKGLTDYYIHIGQKSEQEAAKKANSASLSRAYGRLNDILVNLTNSAGSASYDLAAAALHLGYAVRSEGRRMDYEELAGYANGVFKRYQVKRRNAAQSEASNLWNPTESRYYFQSELSALKAGGGDVSKINPIGDGTYWTQVDIAGQQVGKSFQQDSGLYRNIEFSFPKDGATLEFDEVRRSQSRPKFDVVWDTEGKKKKFKFKFLSETHSEITGSSLLAALGFNTDPSRRIKNVKVRFKDGEKQIFHRDMESYYSLWEMQQGIQEDGRDTQGDYIVFKEALLEARSDELIRVGAWSYTQNGHPETREVRALPVFMAWIANNDMKESGQNKTVLRTESGLDQMYFVSGDLGWSFGNFLFPESISWFKWNVIKDVRDDSVSFNYLTWHYSNLFQFTTWDDARWMVRLIAQLSREQINQAVLLGEWDPSLSKILTEKLVARRNQLVKVFGLDSEFKELQVNLAVAPADDLVEKHFSSSGGILGGGGAGANAKVLDLVQSMSKPVFEYLGPSLMSIQTGLINAALDRAVKPVTEIRISGENLAGLGLPFAAGIILRLHRSVVRNEQPENMNERFLVHDQMVVGWTLGTDLVGVGSSITYYRSFNLIYPVRQQSEGVYKAAYLPALLMPFSAGQYKLPNKHSLLIEDYVEGRGSLKTTGLAPVEISAGVELARVYLTRTLVSDRADKKIDILIDDSHYTELSAKVTGVLRASILSFHFPFFEGAVRKGKIDRELWTIPADSPESRTRARAALSLVAMAMRTDTLPDIARRRTVDADFQMRKWGFNLFNLVTSLDIQTKSDIDETDSEDPNLLLKKFQIENISEILWKAPVFDIQERETVKTFYLGLKGESGEHKDAILGLNIRQWDSATTSQELRDDSVLLAQQLSNDPNFIIFSPALHTNKDQWGAVVTLADVLIYQSGVDRLLNISDDVWWQQFTRVTSIVPNQRRDETRSALDAALIKNFSDFLGLVARARKESNPKKRASLLCDALGKTAVTTSLTSGIKGHLVGVVLSQLPEDSYFISVKISSPLYKQNIFPIEKPLVNRRGILKFKDARLHDFSLNTISVIYNFFNSVIPIGSTVPSIDYKY